MQPAGAAAALNDACVLKAAIDRRALQIAVSNNARARALGELSLRLERTMVALLRTLDDATHHRTG